MFPGLGGVGGTGVQRQGWCFQGAGESEVQASSGGGGVPRIRGRREEDDVDEEQVKNRTFTKG